jgi:hypothetical protein
MIRAYNGLSIIGPEEPPSWSGPAGRQCGEPRDDQRHIVHRQGNHDDLTIAIVSLWKRNGMVEGHS